MWDRVWQVTEKQEVSSSSALSGNESQTLVGGSSSELVGSTVDESPEVWWLEDIIAAREGVFVRSTSYFFDPGQSHMDD